MIKLNAFDTFDGELLFSYLEMEIAVSIDDEQIKVWIGDYDITHLVHPDHLDELEAGWLEGKGIYEADEAADYGDYLYEQEKDRRLDS